MLRAGKCVIKVIMCKVKLLCSFSGVQNTGKHGLCLLDNHCQVLHLEVKGRPLGIDGGAAVNWAHPHVKGGTPFHGYSPAVSRYAPPLKGWTVLQITACPLPPPRLFYLHISNASFLISTKMCTSQHVSARRIFWKQRHQGKKSTHPNRAIQRLCRVR